MKNHTECVLSTAFSPNGTFFELEQQRTIQRATTPSAHSDFVPTSIRKVAPHHKQPNAATIYSKRLSKRTEVRTCHDEESIPRFTLLNDPLPGTSSHLIHALDNLDDLLLRKLLQEVILVHRISDELLRTEKKGS